MQFMASSPRSKCLVCGKDIVVRSTHGRGSVGYCSRVCASMKQHERRFVGPRSEVFSTPIDIERKRNG